MEEYGEWIVKDSDLQNEKDYISNYMNCYNCKSYNKKENYCTMNQKNTRAENSCSTWQENNALDHKKLMFEEINQQPPQIKVNIINSYENVEYFYQQQPFFYDRNRLFWFWNLKKNCYEIVDEIDIINQIEQNLELKGMLSISKRKNEYLEDFKKIGRIKLPEEPTKNWVQFKNRIFDIQTKEIKIVNPQYFFTNPIPWDLGEGEETPIMDKLFTEWVGAEHIKTLYELIAYCCYQSYPIHLLFCLWGNGRNGKSQFLKILDKFIGSNNSTSTELDLIINTRFESFKLYKKLICLIGETNFGTLNNTSLIKKLTGGDKIGFEKKNKDPFDDYNYAKMIIASNSLPTTEDTSDGFYRRWLIIDFPNEFEDTGKEVWEMVPDEEYQNLAKKITLILPKLLLNGKFTGQGDIQHRKKKYISVSNPLSVFIKSECLISPINYITYGKLYNEYVQYLVHHKRRVVNRKEFINALELEGFYVQKTTKDGISDRYVVGIDIKDGGFVVEEIV